MIYIYDIETLSNYFLYCAVNEKDNWHVYEIGAGKNDLRPLIKHLQHPGLQQVGFNNIRFDAQVLHYMLANADQLLTMTGDEIAAVIYQFSQQLIHSQEKFPPFREYELYAQQIDCFRIMHFDNPARRTSLKNLQVAMKWHNVQDMPISHEAIIDDATAPTVIEYCKNDVLSTREFFHKIKAERELRSNLNKSYGVNVTNSPDSTIGEKLFAQMYCEAAGVRWTTIKNLRTPRTSIPVEDIILPYVKFATPELQKLLDFFKNTTIYNTREGVKGTAKVGNVTAHYGMGGVHACIEPGVYTNNTQIIHDIDVSSFYPNLSIVNNWRPEHLGTHFARVYDNIYQTRKNIPKKDSRNLAYKLMLNSVFGKSNSEYSYLYDPQFTMQITINGQLLITMLAERLAEKCTIIQINTDGVTVSYDKEHVDWVRSMCDRWMRVTKLTLEDAYYQKFIVRDVNNYIAQTVDGEVKKKGCFVDVVEWHKDPSAPVIAKALEQYFIHGISPHEYINNHNDWWDYQMRQRFRGKDHGFRANPDGSELDTGKTVRYYVSNNGLPIFKRSWLKGVTERVSMLHDGKLTTLTNVYNGTPLTNLNKGWYINETFRIINQIQPNIRATGEQTTLF